MRVFEPSLPPHCEPTSDYLYRFSSTFHTCVPSDLAFISTLLGTLSILSWLSAQLPQIYKNYSIQSTSGLSIYFLVEWCAGDIFNLLGALFCHQASWQIIVAGYYCFVDFMLVLQWVWYEQLRHGRHLQRVWPGKSRDSEGEDGRDGYMEEVIVGVSASSAVGSDTSSDHSKKDDGRTPAKDIKSGQWVRKAPAWRLPDFNQGDEKDEKTSRSPLSISRTTNYVQPSSSIASPSPRTVLFLACLITLARASPLHQTDQPTSVATITQSTGLETAGTILSWLSTLLYLISRLPQIYKNYRRRSTSGLSFHLFAAAFFGNLFYSSSILTNPCAWDDYASFGGNGWVGPQGSQRVEWVSRALPFWLGAAGVLVLDGAVGVQFLMYGEKASAKVVVVEEGMDGRERRRWMRVSGWMRGWAPSFSEGSTKVVGEERQALLGNAAVAANEGDRSCRYGATA